MTATNENRRPALRAYLVTGQGETARWAEIGAAWSNKDGKGFSLELTAIPLTGRLILREIGEREEDAGPRS